MNPLIRWCKFNLVGVIGMGFQLAALAVLEEYAPHHYLYATAAAIELTLLHNFIWHVRYTWRDRRDRASWFRQSLRFHASNGLVSMVGNLTMMRILVQNAHLPILVANAVAILVCSIVNFAVGDRWVFANSNAGRTLPSQPIQPLPLQRSM
jgi:putative flippase GtrA